MSGMKADHSQPGKGTRTYAFPPNRANSKQTPKFMKATTKHSAPNFSFVKFLLLSITPSFPRSHITKLCQEELYIAIKNYVEENILQSEKIFGDSHLSS